jgi:hypothetical protein
VIDGCCKPAWVLDGAGALLLFIADKPAKELQIKAIATAPTRRLLLNVHLSGETGKLLSVIALPSYLVDFYAVNACSNI